jgi:predicted Zn-dependent protease
MNTVPSAATASIANLDRRAALRALACGAAALAAAGCATNEETGRQQLILVDDGQMQEMALSAWQEQRSQTPIWNNPAQQQRLQRVGARIAVAAGRQSEAWEFALFDTPELNAFVLPGYKVGFYRGLAEICTQDDDMAIVLGHEVGHVTGRHAAERYSEAMVQQGLMDVAGAKLGQGLLLGVLGIGGQLAVTLPHSRAQESEADILGLNYAHRAGFDVKRAIPFWQRMAAGGARAPELLSTHPAPETRIADIRNYINAQGWGPV